MRGSVTVDDDDDEEGEEEEEEGLFRANTVNEKDPEELLSRSCQCGEPGAPLNQIGLVGVFALSKQMEHSRQRLPGKGPGGRTPGLLAGPPGAPFWRCWQN